MRKTDFKRIVVRLKCGRELEFLLETSKII